MSYDIGKSIVISGSTSTLTRRFKTAYRELDADKSTSIKGGTNYYENLNVSFLDTATYPHGPTDTDAVINIPANYLFVGVEDKNTIDRTTTGSNPNQKVKYIFSVVHGRDYYSSSLSYGEVIKSNIVLPVNFISGNLSDGYQADVANNFMSGVIITNLHNDVYGPSKESAVQGPFTNQWVGGRQSRHVSINRGTDDYTTRPEAWKLLLGTGSFSGSYQTALGFVGADYPYPEGNPGSPSFPVLVHKRATYYREELAKRPVNIRNILTTTSSYEHGNYSDTYQVVAVAGRTINNRLLRQAILEGTNTNATELSGVLRTLGGTSAGRTDFALPERSGSSAIIGSRFSAPGGSRYSSRGFLNQYAEELSPYNALSFRNREVLGDSYGNGLLNQAYIVSGADGTGSIAGLSKHSEQFGYNSGSSVIASPHKVNRNTTSYVKNEQYTQRYDNYYVSHQIPQKDTGYSWIADSIASTASNSGSWEYFRHADGITYITANTLTSSLLGYKVSGATITAATQSYSVPQDFVGLNTMTVEPVDVSTNTIGTFSISNITSSLMTTVPTSSNLFNSMMVHRNGAFGLSTFKQLSYRRNDKIAQYLRANNLIQNLDSERNIQTYTEPAIDNSNYPIVVEAYMSQTPITTGSDLYDITLTYDNANAAFSNIDLNRSTGRLNQTNEQTTELLTNALLPQNTNNFYYEPNKITYKKRVFPVSSSPQRKRTSFIHEYWRDSEANRIQTLYTFNNCTLFSASIWPLDSRINYSTTSASFSVTNRNNSTEGILQSLYAQRFDTDSPTSTPIYFYKQSVVNSASVRAPSGIKNTYLPFPTAEIAASVLFANSTKWQVSDDTGYKPYEDTYDSWLNDMQKQKKDYSVLPEYRISSKIPALIDNNFSITALDENYIEITGAYLYASTSSNDLVGAAYIEKLIDDDSNYRTPKITIKLTCETIEKFLPYNGFYPVERTLDLVNAFSQSYSNFISIRSGTTDIPSDNANFKKHYRTMISPLFAPGILYNTIKSGIAVDYPILSTDLTSSVRKYNAAATEKSYQIGNNSFSARLPFETILNPEKYLQGVRLIDMNPHPNVNLSNSTASLYGVADNNYKLMINNFLAETTNIFLKNSSPSSIRSQPASSIKATSGMRYQALLKIYKTTNSVNKKISSDANSSFKDYPRPQYSDDAQENITMFSNPLGFGPPCGSGKWVYGPTEYTSGSKDSVNGYNAPFTPPYYDGESWAIIEFAPTVSKTYSIDEIIGSSSVKYVRYEFDAYGGNYDLANSTDELQGSANLNKNAMQVSASLNLFNIVDAKELTQTFNANGGITSLVSDKTQNKKVWEIASKFETPILNFQPSATLNTVVQTNATASDYGLANAGMWLQYGSIPTNSEGIFMQITDVPNTYIKYGTYGMSGALAPIVSTGGYNVSSSIDTDTIKSLVDLVGFSSEPVRMGELADTRTIKEGIVLVPYTISNTDERQFIKLDRQKVQSFLGGNDSDLSNTAKEQITKLQDYVLPLHLDFINNDNIQPISMYIFEIEKQLNQSDLSNIWQNVMPQSLNKVENNTYSITHTIEDNELLNTLNVDNNRTIKFMCFKVKQRGITKYEFADYDTEQLPKASLINKKQLKQKIRKLKTNPLNQPEKKELDKDLIGYNWPYDYFSLVELAKVDATVEFTNFNSRVVADEVVDGQQISDHTEAITTNTDGSFSIQPIG